VFAPQEVLEGSPAFLTPGLTPKVKAYLEDLAANANLTLWSGGNGLLPSNASPNLYDHQRQRFVFNGGKPVSLLPLPNDYHYGVNLRGQSSGYAGPIGPDELEQRAAYDITYGANAKFSQPASPPAAEETTLRNSPSYRARMSQPLRSIASSNSLTCRSRRAARIRRCRTWDTTSISALRPALSTP
jgi:hypothetical protein